MGGSKGHRQANSAPNFAGSAVRAAGALVLTVALAATVAPAGRASAAEDHLVYGLGQSSCRSFTAAWQHMQSIRLKNYLSWLDGYLSARGTALSRDLKADESTWDLMPWLVEFCEMEPTSRFETAADALIELLRQRR